MKRFFAGLMIAGFAFVTVTSDAAATQAYAVEAVPPNEQVQQVDALEGGPTEPDDAATLDTLNSPEIPEDSGEPGDGAAEPTDDSEPPVAEEPVEFDDSSGTVSLSPTRRVDTAITATVGPWTSTGVAVEGLDLSYQWYVADTAVSGATSTRYTPKAADLNKQITFAVTATKDGFLPLTKWSPAVKVSPASLTGLKTPTISGTSRVGQKLTASTTAWGPGTVKLSYEWWRNGTTRLGTGSTYTLKAADRNAAITVRVTGTKAGYVSQTKTSKSTAKIAAGVLKTKTPTVSGTNKVGKTLQAKSGTWTSGTSYSYQWLRNGKTIKGATKSSYKLARADAGTKVTVKVTGKQKGYTTASRVSASRSIPKVITAYAASFTGTVKVGQTLKAKTKAWKPTGVKLSYQWLRNGAAIKGATKSSYRVSSADAGDKISLKITGKRGGYYTEVRTSGSKTVPKVIKAATPKISGSARWGNTLSAKAGTWKPSGVAFKYQWYRNGAAVKGKTSSKYKLGSADVGASISVKVTGTKSGYATESRTSARTAKVTYPSRYVPSGWSCPTWAPIKGNASSMIYHMPYGAFYSRTNPEECFSSEGAARAAGYRASMR